MTLPHEGNVCIGDVYAVGEARLEVSQPRQPCQNITRRWQLPGLMEWVRDTEPLGWYLRVLAEGTWRRANRGAGRTAVSGMDRCAGDHGHARSRAQPWLCGFRLARVPALADSWRQALGSG